MKSLMMPVASMHKCIIGTVNCNTIYPEVPIAITNHIFQSRPIILHVKVMCYNIYFFYIVSSSL